jgi:hypothetical protein
MMMFKPHKCAIRRSFENGVWVQYRVSPHQMQIHVKVHRIQVCGQHGTLTTIVGAPKIMEESTTKTKEEGRVKSTV